MIQQQLVTIAIPTVSRSGFLIESVESALLQTYPFLEVVVVDNASEDDTPQVLEKLNDPRLRKYRFEERMNMADNWNRCLGLAKGEYFLLLSDDDKLSPNAIEKMVDRFLTAQLEIAFCICRMAFINASGVITRWVPDPPESKNSWDFVINWLWGKYPAPPCNTLFRTQDLRNTMDGGYSRKYGLALDIGACFEIASRYPTVAYEPAAFAYYREHENNDSHQAHFLQWVRAHRSIYKLTAQLVPEEYREKVQMAHDQFMLRFFTKQTPWRKVTFRRYWTMVRPFAHWQFGLMIAKGGYRLIGRRIFSRQK